MRTIIAAAFISAVSFASSASGAGNEDNDAAIRYAVNEFITGIREGDAERIADVSSLEHGHAISPQTKDGARSINSVTFGQLIENLQPYVGYGDPHKIKSIDIIGGELAVANIISNAPQADGDGAILEYFILAKAEDKWEVIALPWIVRKGMLVTDD